MWSRWERLYTFGTCQRAGVGEGDVEFEACGCEEAFHFGVTELASNLVLFLIVFAAPGKLLNPTES